MLFIGVPDNTNTLISSDRLCTEDYQLQYYCCCSVLLLCEHRIGNCPQNHGSPTSKGWVQYGLHTAV